MNDPTEQIRRQRQEEINVLSHSRRAIELANGQVWNTDELRRDFEVLGFMSPMVIVRRKSDGTVGSLEFQHDPRLYFNFVAN